MNKEESAEDVKNMKKRGTVILTQIDKDALAMNANIFEVDNL